VNKSQLELEKVPVLLSKEIALFRRLSVRVSRAFSEDKDAMIKEGEEKKSATI